MKRVLRYSLKSTKIEKNREKKVIQGRITIFLIFPTIPIKKVAAIPNNELAINKGIIPIQFANGPEIIYPRELITDIIIPTKAITLPIFSIGTDN